MTVLASIAGPVDLSGRVTLEIGWPISLDLAPALFVVHSLQGLAQQKPQLGMCMV